MVIMTKSRLSRDPLNNNNANSDLSSDKEVDAMSLIVQLVLIVFAFVFLTAAVMLNMIGST